MISLFQLRRMDVRVQWLKIWTVIGIMVCGLATPSWTEEITQSQQPPLSAAEQDLRKSEAVAMDTMVVTATHPDEMPPYERTASSVSVIRAKDIQQRNADLSEILKRQVGVNIRQYGGMGAVSDIFIRGSTSEQVTIYVDGVPYSATGSGRVGLGSIASGSVETVEIYRGSAPGVFGAGAMGGVINITTKRPDKDQGYNASASYGSFGANHISADGTFRLGETHGLVLTAGRHAAENDFEYTNDRGTETTTDDTVETRKNADYTSINTGISWMWEPSDNHHLSAGVSYNGTEKGVPGNSRVQNLSSRLSSDILLSRLKYDYKQLADALVWGTWENQLFDDPDDEAGRRGSQKVHSDIDRWGITGNFSPVTGPVFNHLQLSYHKETYEAEDELDEANGSLPSRRNNWGCGLESEIMVLSERMWLTPRVHVAHVQDELQNVGKMLAGETSRETNSIDRNPYSYSLGWRHMVRPWMAVRTTYGYYTRLPQFNELFGDTGDVVGNPDLEEEEGWNFDAGIHLGTTKTLFEGELTYFHRRVSGMISRRDYGDYLSYENISDALITGLELFATGRTPGDLFSATAGVTYQEPLNKSDYTEFRKKRYYNKDLPYRPRWQTSVSVEYRPIYRLAISGEMLYRGESYSGPSNFEATKLDEALLFNLSANISLSKQWQVIVDAENLTDDRSVDRWGYPKPGRGFYITVKWAY